MSRSYVKMEYLAEKVFRHKAAGETNREIGEHFGLTGKQIKQLATAKAIALILAHPFKIDPYRKFFSKSIRVFRSVGRLIPWR